jgi:hypothetical protein
MRNRAHRLALFCAWATLAAEPASSQLLQGEVTGSDGTLIQSALVELLDADGEAVANHLTGSDGVYRLDVPAPGTYLIRAEAPGWAPYRSGTFEMTGLAGVFRVDLIMEPEPFELPGLDVSVERLERVAGQLRLLLGRDVASLRNAPIGIEDFRDAWELGWDLTDILRRGGAAGVIVKETPRTVCIEHRQRCLPVFLNGMRVPDEMVRELPLEMLEVGVIVQPSETVQGAVGQGTGGVFLYTVHWLQEAG